MEINDLVLGKIIVERNSEFRQLNNDLELVAETHGMLLEQVKQQGQQIDQIETNIGSAADQTEQANNNLNSANNYKNRLWASLAFVGGAVVVGTVGVAYNFFKRENNHIKPPE
jgi:t-SNARE complex subunit (syntaxin)